LDALRRLSGQLVNEEFSVFFVEVMEAGLHRSQDVVRLETYHIVKKSAEFVHFTPNLDIRSGILLEKGILLLDFLL